jgi:hypothetical protein
MHDRPWRVNDGRKPRAPPETLVELYWANGNPARHLYQIQQLTWDIRGWDFDIHKYRRA